MKRVKGEKGSAAADRRRERSVEEWPRNDGRRRCHERKERTIRRMKQSAVAVKRRRDRRRTRGDKECEDGRAGIDLPDAPEWMKYVSAEEVSRPEGRRWEKEKSK